MSIVYIGLVPRDPSGKSPLNSTTYFIRPIFRTMKCLDRYTRSAAGKCMVFIDEFGWVYPNWASFKANTNYPDTDIVAPELGVFSRNDMGIVKLDAFTAPHTAEEIEKEKWANIRMTVGGIGSAAVLAGASVFPVTAPFVWGAMGVGAIIGVVSGYNSALRLAKLSHHEQDISLGSSEARSHWLAISGTFLGFAASGATTVIRGAAVSGNVSRSLVVASNTVCGANLVVSGVSVANNIFSMAADDRKVSPADVLQLSFSLFLFTHSVYNYQTAQQVIRETQTQHLDNYKSTLSKNGRRNFQKKLNARARQSGADAAHGDTIRNLNTSEHYTSNFKGTLEAKPTISQAETNQVKDSVLPVVRKYGPAVVMGLANVYRIIVNSEGEDIWDLLMNMAGQLLDRYARSSQGLTLDVVVRTIYNIVDAAAKKLKVSVADTLKDFKAKKTFDSIPVEVKMYYKVFEPTIGKFTCKCCGGARLTDD